jgi:hypothetical protein
MEKYRVRQKHLTVFEILKTSVPVKRHFSTDRHYVQCFLEFS